MFTYQNDHCTAHLLKEVVLQAEAAFRARKAPRKREYPAASLLRQLLSDCRIVK